MLRQTTLATLTALGLAACYVNPANSAEITYKATLNTGSETGNISFEACPPNATETSLENLLAAWRSSVAEGKSALGELECTTVIDRVVIGSIVLEGTFSDSAGDPHALTIVRLSYHMNGRMNPAFGILFDALVLEIGDEKSA